MKRSLQNITNKIFVKTPKTPTEITESFLKEEIWKKFGVSKTNNESPFFKACIQEDNFCYCIFISQKIIILITEYIPVAQRVFLLDGTFKIGLQGCFKQLLIIHVDYFEEKVSGNILN